MTGGVGAGNPVDSESSIINTCSVMSRFTTPMSL